MGTEFLIILFHFHFFCFIVQQHLTLIMLVRLITNVDITNLINSFKGMMRKHSFIIDLSKAQSFHINIDQQR